MKILKWVKLFLYSNLFIIMKYSIVLFFLLLVSNAFLLGQERRKIQPVLDSLVLKKAIPGILVGMMDSSGTYYFTAGFADSAGQKAFNPNTQLEIGSITKTFTAYVLTAVLAKHNIADTAFIAPYLPDSVQQNKGIQKIRFIQLLNHTAGLPRLPDNMGTPANFLQPYKDYTLDKLFGYLKKANPANAGKVDYSNLGMGLAGVLAERIAKKSLQDLFQSYILRPFGLKHSSFTINKKQPISIGYFNTLAAQYWDMNCLAGAGGLKSDAGDILAYLNFCVKNFSSPLIQLVTTETASINSRIAVARGWHILKRSRTTPVFWHNGGTYGFSTFAAFNPVAKKMVFIAINAFNKNDIGDELGIKIMQGLLDR